MENKSKEDITNKILKLYEQLKTKAMPHRTLWTEIAEYFSPRSSIVGKHSSDRLELYDTTPEDANEVLASALHTYLTNPAHDWVALRQVGENSKIDSDILEDIVKAVMAVTTSDKSGFGEQIDQMYLKFPWCGNGVLYSEEDEEADVVFKEFPAWHCLFEMDHRGKPNILIRDVEYTASQLVDKFGEDKVSDEVKKAFLDNPSKEIKCIHAVYPSKMFGKDKADKPFSASYIEINSKHTIEESGYYEFPYHIARWRLSEGAYAYGPGAKALPDARSLNAIERDSLIASETMADPPKYAPDDAFLADPSSDAGTMNYYRAGLGRESIFTLQTNADLRVYDAKAEQKRQAIRKAFLNDRLEQQGGPAKTATEVQHIEQQNMIILGPVVGRLQSEFLPSLVERIIQILIRRDKIKLPETDKKVKIEYVSPITRSQKQTEAQSFTNAMPFIGTVLQIKPQAADNLDADKIIRATKDMFGYSSSFLTDEKQRDESRSAQAEAQQQQQDVSQAGEETQLVGQMQQVMANAEE